MAKLTYRPQPKVGHEPVPGPSLRGPLQDPLEILRSLDASGSMLGPAPKKDPTRRNKRATAVRLVLTDGAQDLEPPRQ